MKRAGNESEELHIPVEPMTKRKRGCLNVTEQKRHDLIAPTHAVQKDLQTLAEEEKLAFHNYRDARRSMRATSPSLHGACSFWTEGLK